jgi:RimJ/RimL family protein N-acetyltransferase
MHQLSPYLINNFANRIAGKCILIFKYGILLCVNAYFYLRIKKVNFQSITDEDGNILYFESLKRKDLRTIWNMSPDTFGIDVNRDKRVLLSLFCDKFCYVLRNRSSEIIGTASYYIKLDEYKDSNVHLGTLIINKQFRHHGYSSLIIRLSVNELKRSKVIRGISVDIRSDNFRSLRAILSNGFALKYSHLHASSKVLMYYFSKVL